MNDERKNALYNKGAAEFNKKRTEGTKPLKDKRAVITFNP